MTIIITVICTIVACIGVFCWMFEFDMDYPFLSLIAYIVWPVSAVFLFIYLWLFQEAHDRYRKRRRDAVTKALEQYREMENRVYAETFAPNAHEDIKH